MKNLSLPNMVLIYGFLLFLSAFVIPNAIYQPVAFWLGLFVIVMTFNSSEKEIKEWGPISVYAVKSVGVLLLCIGLIILFDYLIQDKSYSWMVFLVALVSTIIYQFFKRTR